MISQILKTPAKVKKITEAAFKAIDTDGGGYLEKAQLEQIMVGVAEDIGLERPSKEQIEEIVKGLDSSGTGRLCMDDFKVLVEEVLRTVAKSQELS